jgi:hypothetical protein
VGLLCTPLDRVTEDGEIDLCDGWSTYCVGRLSVGTPDGSDALINVTGESGWVLRRFRSFNFSSEFIGDLDQFVVNDHEFVVVSDWLVRYVVHVFGEAAESVTDFEL